MSKTATSSRVPPRLTAVKDADPSADLEKARSLVAQADAACEARKAKFLEEFDALCEKHGVELHAKPVELQVVLRS